MKILENRQKNLLQVSAFQKIVYFMGVIAPPPPETLNFIGGGDLSNFSSTWGDPTIPHS